MPFDENLALRLRRALAGSAGVTEQPMFGGLCFLLRGNMLCGVHRERLMFRVGSEQEAEALARPGARRMDITGKPMAGFIFVDAGTCDGPALSGWVALAENYVGALPPKAKKVKAKKAPAPPQAT